jgi:hypothetical protein
MESARTVTAFAGSRRVATGPLAAVLRKAKPLVDRSDGEPVLFFEDDTGRQVDFDFRGTADEVVARATPAAAPPGPGRPKLGVVSREVSLLERHWAWLEAQPQGISAALRRLVDEARKLDPEKESARRAIEATSRVMTALAGNRRGFEEASRALFARDQKRFEAIIRRWPKDVSAHLRRLVGRSMTSSAFDRE